MPSSALPTATAIANADGAYGAAASAADSAGQPTPSRDTLDTLSPRAKEAQADLVAKRNAVHQRADEIDTAADALGGEAHTYADASASATAACSYLDARSRMAQ